MNAKYLMVSSSLSLGVIGISLTFMPEEIISLLKFNGNTISALILQITGSLYIGFSILNWMARGNIIGGIYSKPIAMGNFTHFFIGGMALIKFVASTRGPVILLIAAIIYIIFALWFGLVMFSHPAKESQS